MTRLQEDATKGIVDFEAELEALIKTYLKAGVRIELLTDALWKAFEEYEEGGDEAE